MDERVTKTLNEMFHDRGYDVSNIETQDSKMVIANHINVYIINDAKVGVNHMKDIRTELTTSSIKYVIIVYSFNVTSFAKQAIEEMKKDGYTVELFKNSELYFNITHHDLVPPHRLLSVDEKAALLKKYRIRPVNLPCIKQNDAVAKYMGLKPGDVVEITRASEISDVSLYYRICTCLGCTCVECRCAEKNNRIN